MMINALENFSCTKEFSNWEDALNLLQNGEIPDLILSDIGLPGTDGITGVAKMRDLAPDIPVIMLTVFDEDEEIVQSLRQALRGGSPLNAQIAGKILSMFSNLKKGKQTYDLTAREKEILGLVAMGHTKKAIGLELDISYHTVDTHVRHIYKKLQVNCKSEAVAKAIRERLI